MKFTSWIKLMPKFRHVMSLTIFLVLFLLVLYFVTKKTDAYIEASRYIANDRQIAETIGDVNKTDFKFLNGFEFNGNDANFSIEATSNKGVFVFEVRLRRVTGEWIVVSAEK